jgi:hypothetical protein
MQQSEDRPSVSLEELERERLQTYLDWAQVRAPWWYWPAYALAIAAWFVGYGMGTGWGLAGAALVVLVALVGIRVIADRAQVSMPRFRGMPGPLKRSYLPVAVAAIGFVGAMLYVVVSASAPYLVLGVTAGAGMALAGAWTSHRYRAEAARLERGEGLG